MRFRSSITVCVFVKHLQPIVFISYLCVPLVQNNAIRIQSSSIKCAAAKVLEQCKLYYCTMNCFNNTEFSPESCAPYVLPLQTVVWTSIDTNIVMTSEPMTTAQNCESLLPLRSGTAMTPMDSNSCIFFSSSENGCCELHKCLFNLKTIWRLFSLFVKLWFLMKQLVSSRFLWYSRYSISNPFHWVHHSQLVQS